MKPVILAGGEPKRISVLVPSDRSKHTLHVLGKPIIYYPIHAIERVLRQDIVLVYSYEDALKEALRHSRRRVIGVEQRGHGIEAAIISASDKLNDVDYFLLVYGDLIFDSQALSSLVEAFYSVEPAAAILTIPLEERFAYTYGVVSIDLGGLVKKVIEKPASIEEIERPAYTIGGVYILPTWIIDYLEGGLSLPEALAKIASDRKVIAVHWNGLWIDIGYPADLLEASRLLLDRIRGQYIADDVEIENTALIEPPAIIENGVYIDHYAVIKGPVYIGRNSFIGAHSFVRHYTSLEERIRIGAYTEVKNSNLQPHIVVDSFSYLGDSVIGENTSIGSHVVTLNVIPSEETPPRLRKHLVYPQTIKKPVLKLGAIIGYNVKLGAGTILYPQSIVPPETHIEPGTVYRTKIEMP